MKSEKITPLKRLFRLLATQKDLLVNVYIYALFNGLLNLSIPLGIQAIINLIQSGTTSTSWVVLVGLVLVGLTLAGIFQVYQLSSAETIQQKIFANASIEFAYRFPRLKLSALRDNYAPELVNRFFDIVTVQKGLSKILFDFSLAGLQILLGLFLLALYHPFFIVFGLLLVLTLIAFFYFTTQKGLSTSLAESKYKYKLVSWLEEVARNLSTFKMAGTTRLPMERTDELGMEYLHARQKHFKILVRQFGAMIGLKVLITGSLLILGGMLVFQQEMNIGQFVAAEIIILLVINSVEKLILSMETIYDVLTGLEKVGGVTDLGLEQEENGKDLAVSGVGISVTAKELTLPSPQNPTKLILKDLSFTIKKGEKIGLVGDMGAGKSSFLHLLAGLFDEFKGNLLFNNIPLKHLDLSSLRTVIGDNLREQEIFEASLQQNITLGKEVNEEVFNEVLSITGLSSFVEELPNGLETMLPTSGMGLAKSVRSRIIMARSLVGDHQMLLLEDSWHGVQPKVVQGWFDYICGHHCPTLVLSTNNKALLERMDRIFVLKNGELIRTATFNDIQDQLPC
jgi:ABC-type bacteriocin/lantibiotic exporter with double-glycine peptidase domain